MLEFDDLTIWPFDGGLLTAAPAAQQNHRTRDALLHHLLFVRLRVHRMSLCVYRADDLQVSETVPS